MLDIVAQDRMASGVGVGYQPVDYAMYSVRRLSAYGNNSRTSQRAGMRCLKTRGCR